MLRHCFSIVFSLLRSDRRRAPLNLRKTNLVYGDDVVAGENHALGFALVASLWTTTRLHGVDYAAVAMLGICLLLLNGALDWEVILAEHAAWDVFVWYGGMDRLAEALGESGITKRFAEGARVYVRLAMGAALAVLAVIYFYAHYAFASISAHALAMYTPFLLVIVGAGAPAGLAVPLLAYFSNLSAGLIHDGTTRVQSTLAQDMYPSRRGGGWD